MPDQSLPNPAPDEAQPAPAGSRRPAPKLERPDVSILIVAFNSAALIEACITAIEPACGDRSYEVLLVDNGDGSTEELVRARFPEVRIVPSRGNIGFAAGNNLLASEARGSNILLLNPDMVAAPGAISRLLAAAERYPDAGAWGALTVDQNGQPDSGNDIYVPSISQLLVGLVGHARRWRAPLCGTTRDEPVEVLCGGFVMFPKRVWDSAGGLDESYFLYSEEVDLFYRLSLEGFVFWRIPEAKGYHAIGHGDSQSPMRLLFRSAGLMHFTRRHWSPMRGLTAFVLIWVAGLVRFCAGALLAWRSERFRRLRDGYRLVALRPHYWGFGYHPARGLKARLVRQQKL